MTGRRLLAFFVLLGIAAPVLAAQTYPQRAVRMIVPYPPGGAGDIVGRMLALRLTESFGQQVVTSSTSRIKARDPQGAEPVGGTAQDLQNHMKAEIAQWVKLVKQAKITAD